MKFDSPYVKSFFTPSILSNMGHIDDGYDQNREFNPNDNWTNKYRLWEFSNYSSQAKNKGWMIIKHSGGKNELDVKLNYLCDHNYIDKGYFRLTDVSIAYKNSVLQTPARWTYQSRLKTSAQLYNRIDLQLTKNCRISNGFVVTELNNTKKKQKVGHNVTSDWNLLSAVQSLPFEYDSTISFDLLEELNTLRPNNKITFMGKSQQKWCNKTVELYCFYQSGNGKNSIHYWLDEKHRLLAVISDNKALIYDRFADRSYLS